MTPTPHHRIAIIGGGLGGLTTAAVLQANGIDSTVSELEAGRHVRTQGGMLDIHQDSGQLAPRAAGLFDQFLARIEVCGEAMHILAKHGAVLRDEPDHGDIGRREIDRGTLRDLLLDSLPDGTAVGQRGQHRTPAPRPPRPAGRHKVELAGGSTFTTDLLIGADGAWSRIRPLLSGARPIYSGILFVEADLFDADTEHPADAEFMGEGMPSRWAATPA